MSAVERYLDELFDRLASSGAAGRRTLAEAEDHLREAVSAAMAKGMPLGEAEREAVARFGSASLVASQVRQSHAGGRLSQALLSAWLAACLATVGLGACYLVAAARLAALAVQHPDCRYYLSQSCLVVEPLARQAAETGAIVLGIGLLLLLMRMLVVCHADLASAIRRIRCLRVSIRAVMITCVVLAGLGGFAVSGIGVDRAVGVARDPWQLLPSDPLVHLLGLQVPLVVCSGSICASFVTAAASLIRSRASGSEPACLDRRGRDRQAPGPGMDCRL